MIQSSYTKVSKSVGMDLKVVDIPEVNAAHDLAERVKGKDLAAFREAFKIKRFAPSPTNAAEEEALEIVLDSMNLVENHWRKN